MTEKHTPIQEELELVEELEDKTAPGIYLNHNETLVDEMASE